MLRLTNTMSGEKEEFTSINARKVDMYVCGITPYDNAHIGHGRCNVAFDVVCRLLGFLGYEVRYCRNLTDIDDKILAKARELYGDRMRYTDVTAPVITRFHEEVAALNCLPPSFEPRVTDNIDAIILFIERLIGAGKAYQSDGDVYFSVREFPAYGALSKRKLEDLRVGVRIDVNEKKNDPLDFALWKADPEGEFWPSPWGHGRPGWHIECSAMAARYLGERIDIHAGGLDLMFPHHENEIAQTEALTGQPFASYWLHNGFVLVDNEKMSKSLGNFVTLQDAFREHDPMVLRYYFINHHYRAPLDFSLVGLAAAQKSYHKLSCLLDRVSCDDCGSLTAESLRSDTVKRMLAFMEDDINTPGMLGVLFESLDTLKGNLDSLCEVKLFLEQVLGLICKPLPEVEVLLTAEVQKLIEEREVARAARDWKRADEVRDRLRDLGYEVRDKKIE